MSQLSDYSFERGLVRLSFSDGRRVQVRETSLSKYLSGDDLLRVEKAARLRRNFLKELPPWAQLVFAAIGVAALVLGTAATASWFEKQGAAPQSQSSQGESRKTMESIPPSETQITPSVTPPPAEEVSGVGITERVSKTILPTDLKSLRSLLPVSIPEEPLPLP